MSASYESTPQTTLHRIPARGTYDRAVVHAILDEALVCHLGVVGASPAGAPLAPLAEVQPFVIPTTFARDGETLFVHGAAASRTLRALGHGARACVTVTLVDGLVLARSAFHHSMNYRSVVVLGAAHEVTDPDEKRRALALFVEKASPGRSLQVRPPSEKELRATSVLALPLVEVSAKIRIGQPNEDAPDLGIPVWGGVVPLGVAVTGTPVPEDAAAVTQALPTLPAFLTPLSR